jgi:hypothetical protein
LTQCLFRLPCADDDLVIVFAVELAHFVDEMNRNRASIYVYRTCHGDGGAGQLVTDAIGLVGTFRQFHTDDGWQQSMWDIIFVGGDDCDHKPRIRPVWGAQIRFKIQGTSIVTNTGRTSASVSSWHRRGIHSLPRCSGRIWRRFLVGSATMISSTENRRRRA